MPSRLVALNVLLGAVAVALVLYVGWELYQPTPPARPRATPAGAGGPPGTPLGPTRPLGPEPGAAWSVIANRNLFSPTRSEGPVTPATGSGGPQLPKPMLYGVVLRNGTRIAYLEDPVTKRVAAYRVGDVVAGSTVQSISADQVVLARPEGTVDVRLHDPTKPKAPLPPPGSPGVAPGMPQVPPVPGMPVPGMVPSTPFPPPQPAFQPPMGEGSELPPVPVRPPVPRPGGPPSLYRRVPPGVQPPPPQ
jgi:hypothetical protein